MVRVSDADSTDGTALHRERAILYLGIGVLLVLSPAVIDPVSDTLEPGPSYTYEAIEVTAQNGEFAFAGPPPDDGIEGVDCISIYSRLCGLEVEQLDGNVTVEEINPVERQSARYVEFFDQYYRRVHHRNDSHITYSLEPVLARTVLETISVSIDQTADPAATRTIISRNPRTIDHELSTPEQVVAVDGSYYVFNLQRAETPRDTSGQVDGILLLGSGLGFILGIWSLRRGWIQYDRWLDR